MREDGFLAGVSLPAPNRDIDVVRIKLDRRGAPAGPLGGQEDGAGPREAIEDQAAFLGAVLDRIADQRLLR